MFCVHGFPLSLDVCSLEWLGTLVSSHFWVGTPRIVTLNLYSLGHLRFSLVLKGMTLPDFPSLGGVTRQGSELLESRHPRAR